jgi:hypothetical protein
MLSHGKELSFKDTSVTLSRSPAGEFNPRREDHDHGYEEKVEEEEGREEVVLIRTRCRLLRHRLLRI